MDPTRTATLRRKFVAEFRRRFKRLGRDLTEWLITDDMLGLTAEPGQPMSLVVMQKFGAPRRFQFMTDEQKVREFQRWLANEFGDWILPQSADVGDYYWDRYVQDGYRKGAGRAFDDTRVAQRAIASGEEQLAWFQGTREEFLRSAFAHPVAVEKVKLLSSRVLTELKGVTEFMAQRMSRELADGLVQGDNVRVIGRRLHKTLKIGRQRAETIARTEIIRTHAEGQLDAMERMGVEDIGVAVEWSAVPDDRLCPLCASLDGVVMKRKEARGLIPRHPNCVVGESVIEADDVFAVLKTHFTGEIIELITAKGRQLSVTSNHILLTEHGFLPACFAYQGLQVVEAPNRRFFSAQAPDNHAHKSSIADVFASVLELPAMLSDSMPLTAEDLHGDGRFCDPKVDIIWPDSELWCQAELASYQSKLPFQSFQFAERHGGFATLSTMAQFLKCIAFAFDGSMGRSRDLLAFSNGHQVHSCMHRLGAVARLNSGISESLIDRAAAASEVYRECIRAHPFVEHVNEGIDRDIDARLTRKISNQFTGFLEMTFDCVPFDPEIPPYGSAGLSGAVATDHLVERKLLGSVTEPFTGSVLCDRIVDVRVTHVVDLPVYDIQTHSTVYRVNGLVTSNCRCAFVPANLGEPKRRRGGYVSGGKVKLGQIKQKRTEKQIEEALDKSVKQEAPKRPLKKQKERTTWVGADRDIDKERPENLFD